MRTLPEQTTPAATLLIDGTAPTWRSYWRELCGFREVAHMLIRRDLIVRFRQTYFGLAWMLFKPLMLMLVMSFVFGVLSGFEKSHAAPYSLIIFCGVIPWYFVTNAVPDGMNSLLVHFQVIQKTYFPRAIIPVTAVAVDAIEFLVAWLLFVLGCLWFDFWPDWRVVLFPLLCLQLIVLCTGIGVWLSVINLRFRDIGNLVPFLLTVGFFVTPVGYTLAHVPQEWRLVYSLNPLVGIIEGLRWSLLRGLEGFPLAPMLISAAVTALVALAAARHFLANEAKLVDLA
jgi:lipopolysaccharide transport system permease protein